MSKVEILSNGSFAGLAASALGFFVAEVVKHDALAVQIKTLSTIVLIPAGIGIVIVIAYVIYAMTLFVRACSRMPATEINEMLRLLEQAARPPREFEPKRIVFKD